MDLKKHYNLQCCYYLSLSTGTDSCKNTIESNLATGLENWPRCLLNWSSFLTLSPTYYNGGPQRVFSKFYIVSSTGQYLPMHEWIKGLSSLYSLPHLVTFIRKELPVFLDLRFQDLVDPDVEQLGPVERVRPRLLDDPDGEVQALEQGPIRIHLTYLPGGCIAQR